MSDSQGPSNVGVVLIAGANVTLTPTLAVGGKQTISASGGGAVNAGQGVIVTNGSTVSVDNSGSAIAAGGHITVTVSNGVNFLNINGGTVATTIDLAAPVYQGQPIILAIRQGATPEAINFGTSVVDGAIGGAFTATATAGYTDYVRLMGANASQWAFVGLALGYNV